MQKVLQPCVLAHILVCNWWIHSSQYFHQRQLDPRALQGNSITVECLFLCLRHIQGLVQAWKKKDTKTSSQINWKNIIIGSQVLKAYVHARCIARPVLQKKKFRVVENRSLQCVESIFAKSGLKESLNRFFWYFSLHLFGYFGLVSSLFVSVSVCFTAVLGGAIETYEVHSSPWIRFLNLWRDGKEALGWKFYRQRVCRVL